MNFSCLLSFRMMCIILWIRDSFAGGLGVASWDDSQHPIQAMRYRLGHKIEIHRKILKDASRRVRTRAGMARQLALLCATAG
jgi:hypothetical protein